MRRDILERIKEEFAGKDFVKEHKIGGHSYTLKLLNAGEEEWRDRHVPASMSLATLTARKIATVAASIVAIDGVSVKDIFGSDSDSGGESVISVMTDLYKSEYYVQEKVLEFLKGLPGKFIDELFDKYLELEKERQEGLENFFGKRV